MNSSNRSFLLLAIALLGGFDLFLIYTNIDRQAQINVLQARVSNLERNGFSPDELFYVKKKYIPKQDMSLVVFFSQHGCSACMSYEIPNYQNLYEQYEDRLQAYFIGTTETYLESLGADFPYRTINSPAEVVGNQELAVTNPVALLIDSSGMIHDVYVAEVGNHEKSDLFYQRMHSLFESLQSESSSIETVSSK